MSRRHLWTQVANDVLGDGNWHPVAEVKRRMVEVIPAGVARRAHLRNVARQRRRDGVTKPRPDLPIDESIRSGANDIANKTICNATHWERSGDLIRLKP